VLIADKGKKDQTQDVEDDKIKIKIRKELEVVMEIEKRIRS